MPNIYREHLPGPADLLSALIIAGLCGSAAARAGDTATEPVIASIPYNAGQHGFPFSALAFASASGFVNPVNLSASGYSEAEFTMTGTANVYVASGTWGKDGNWPVVVANTNQPYITRLLVRIPAASKFNGTVVIEWLDVTSGYDTDADFAQAYAEFLRGGYAWIGVSAQAAGVNALKSWDASRYLSLNLNDDSLSYDIFSQTAQAARDQYSVLLGGLKPGKIIGSGQSQSASRLVTYANAFQPLTHSFDGFMIHSRGTKAAPLGNGVTARVPSIAYIRADNGTPVLQLESEANVVGSQNFQKARQADSSFLRTWEVAGASHVDQYANNVLNVEFVHQFPDQSAPQCKDPINSFPFHYAEQSAWSALKQWVSSGTLPPDSPQIAIEKRQVVLDSNGNAEGGLRLPDLDVPIAAYGISNAYVYKSGSSGARQGRLSCTSLGNTAQFDTPTLTWLYPSHSVYVSQYTSAANAAAAAGFLLPADASAAVTAARLRNIPPAQ